MQADFESLLPEKSLANGEYFSQVLKDTTNDYEL